MTLYLTDNTAATEIKALLDSIRVAVENANQHMLDTELNNQRILGRLHWG